MLLYTLSNNFHPQPALTKAQAKQQRNATYRSAQEQKKFAQEAKNRERKEEKSLAGLLRNFGPQTQEMATSPDADMA